MWTRARFLPEQSALGRIESAIQKGTRVLISLWDSLMFGRVPGPVISVVRTRPQEERVSCLFENELRNE